MKKTKSTFKGTGPKILLFDIETAPMLGYVWGLWDQNVGLNQIKSDWHVLSWSAKWLDDDKIMYMDQSKSRHIEDDKKILQGIWNLLDEADITITQNGIRFDHKKLNTRFLLHGFKPHSPVKMVDTLVMAKGSFAFTSNKLEYLSDKVNKKYKKMTKDRKFHGFELWKECLAGNKAAWKEMEVYNKYDVLALEELYKILVPWAPKFNLNLFTSDTTNVCNVCASAKVHRRGYQYTTTGKFQKFQCQDCGAWSHSKENLRTPHKRKTLRTNTPR